MSFMTSHAEFKLTYDGPAVEAGTMDVRDLAPALLAVGQFIEASNRVIYGENATARVQVRTVSPGSFQIGLDIGVSFLQSMRDMLSGPEATAAANLIQIVTAGVGGFGLFKLIRWMRGRPASTIRRTKPGEVEITIDGQSIVIPEAVARLATDANVRNALEKMVVDPLNRDGIERVDIGAAGVVEVITKEESYFFVAPLDRESDVFESRFRAPFSIITLTFKEGNKWRLHDGKAAVNAVVTDTEFLDRVNKNQVAFTKGDLLICDVRVITRQIGSGLKAEYFIDRVIEHRKPYRPPELFEDDAG